MPFGKTTRKPWTILYRDGNDTVVVQCSVRKSRAMKKLRNILVTHPFATLVEPQR